MVPQIIVESSAMNTPKLIRAFVSSTSPMVDYHPYEMSEWKQLPPNFLHSVIAMTMYLLTGVNGCMMLFTKAMYL